MSKSVEVKAMERAKIQLMQIRGTVFYSTILFSLKLVWDPTCKTAGTNGKLLVVNPDYFLGLTEEERIGLLAHEVLHVALNHMTRKGERHPKVWNYAADHVINLELLKAGYKLPPGGLHEKRFRGMHTEEVYDILWDKIEKAALNSEPGPDDLVVPGGEDIIYPGSEEEHIEVERAVADTVKRATLTANSVNEQPGSISGEVDIMLERILNPQLPWYAILQNYMTGFAKDDYSWRRPNRRYRPEHYLPIPYSEALGEIAQAFDISGSVHPSEVSYYVGETSAIMEMLAPQKLTVLSFDTKIRNIQEFTSESDIYSEIELKGGGGTEIDEVLQWVIDNEPVVMLIFTDGYFEMPDEYLHPTTPVIWLIHDNPHWIAPFGKVIHYDMGR